MAPMTRSRATRDGTVPTLYGDYFAQRASAGLLITGGTMIGPEAIGFPATPGIWTETQEESWRAVVSDVHAADGRIAMQLMHCGRVSLTQWQPDGAAPVSASARAAESRQLQAPTGALLPAAMPRALDITEIPDLVATFAAAARRARAAGFDAVEIHAADGYLVDQFLRDGVNDRHDRYGGSPENRARFLLEVTEAVAKEVGADRTAVRLSPTSTHNDMSDADPLATFSTALQQLGKLDLAWTHLAGLGDTDLTRRLRDAYARPFVLNGGFSAETADAAIREELAIAVSFGTAFIANPDLVERLAADHPLQAADPATWYDGGSAGFTDYPTFPEAERDRQE